MCICFSTTAKEHMRIHTGDKPFICTLCNKCFSLNKALYKHTRDKHPKYFPEFKKANDLPLNQRRAREKMRREAMKRGVKVDPGAGLVKSEQDETDSGDFNDIPSALNLQRVTPKVEKFDEEVDDINDVPKDFSKINSLDSDIVPKTEGIDDNIKYTPYLVDPKTLAKIEKTDLSDTNSEIPFIKVEKTEYDDS